MATRTELSSKQHTGLKVAPNAQIKHAAKQHIMTLLASEIANASTCFPVFASRNKARDSWVFSGMTSFELEQNLYVQNMRWTPFFYPMSLRTYPLFLMPSTKQENTYAVGFDLQSEALSMIEGIDLFQKSGKATKYLADVTQMLNVTTGKLKQSYEFGNILEQLGLFKEIDVNVQYADGTLNKIKGLYTINEDGLQALEGEKLERLNKAGYLTPIHALLVSLYQLNVLVDKHNAFENKTKISAVKIEVSTETTHT